MLLSFVDSRTVTWGARAMSQEGLLYAYCISHNNDADEVKWKEFINRGFIKGTLRNCGTHREDVSWPVLVDAEKAENYEEKVEEIRQDWRPHVAEEVEQLATCRK